MSSPPDKPGPSNPYARRTVWGRTSQAPFRIGGAPRVSGLKTEPVNRAPGAPAAAAPVVPKPVPPPGAGEGILGSSPLLPRRPAGLPPAPRAAPPPAGKPKAVQTRPAARSEPKPRRAPEAAPVAAPPEAIIEPSAPSIPPPAQHAETLSKPYRPPGALIVRRLAIAGIVAGSIALIIVASLLLTRRDVEILDAPSPAAAPAQVVPGEVLSAPATADLPAPLTARATLPPVAGQPAAATPPPAVTAPSRAPPTAAAPAAAPVTTPPIVAPPVLVVPPPPVLEVPPPAAPKPAPPPAARPTDDPDAPIVLRKEEE
ncbi:MAG: hypothetical protein Q8L23_12710 [Caulobacter sp.]|nr:hypothetical protein [Caulobacter sp.]